ncbi:hypothetical protein [Geodermatophilus chilensis]|uniref:hypothetical protein n=1 Tax=Geodermatophilus chilensis TaxID=2035835 RepID=UPI0012FFEB1B|nr:hypothetical protein [Geodermatophilus chilensis]
MTVPPAPAPSSVGISTRQLRDVALRALRARGVPYGPASDAAAGVERMEVVAQCGLSALVAVLGREPATPAFTVSADAAGQPAVPADASGVLLAPPVRDLLAAVPQELVFLALHEPWMLAPALADHGRRTARTLRLQWDGPSGPGSCVVAGGRLHLDGRLAAAPVPWRGRLEFTDEVKEPPAGPGLGGDEEAALLTAARRSGLAVAAADWELAVASARRFLVEDLP